MNSALLASSCTNQGYSPPPFLTFTPLTIFSPVADNLDTYVTDVIFKDEIECFQPTGTLPWLVDPCCNVFLAVIIFSFFYFLSPPLIHINPLTPSLPSQYVTCCLPFDYNTTMSRHGETADVSECGEEQCARSYYEDLSFSLNYLEDEALGCTSGITVWCFYFIYFSFYFFFLFFVC